MLPGWSHPCSGKSSYSYPDPPLGDDVHDDELRALYACANPAIPLRSLSPR